MKNFMCFVRHKLTRKVFIVSAENEQAACLKLQVHLGGDASFVSEGIYEAEQSVTEKAGA